jgi:peptide/nickel transport system permease protein
MSDSSIVETAAVEVERSRLRLRLLQLRIYARNPGALISGIFLVAVLIVVVVGPMVITTNPNTFGLKTVAPPSWAHPLGTDEYGRDVLIRTIFGGRSTLFASLIAIAIGGLIGSIVGMIAGYLGQWVDRVLTLLTDIMLAFPGLVLILMVVSILGAGPTSVQVAVGISMIPIYIRLVRAGVWELKNQQFFEAARALGCPAHLIILRHLLPNLFMPLLVLTTSALGWAIAAGAGVNYLGLGVQLPNPDWGLDLAQALNYVIVAWWMISPGIMIMLVILAINLVGDGMQTSLDPKLRYRM